MITVWKFPLPLIGGLVEMPSDARLLHVHAQNGVPCLWAEVKLPPKAIVTRQFYPVGTGHAVPPGEDVFYVGTTLHNNGELVLHWYETTPGGVAW